MPKKVKKAKGKSGKKRVGKKGAKKKIAKTKLEIAMEKYQRTPGKYKELINSADRWLENHLEELVELLKLHSNYSQDCVTYDDFKAALVTLQFPFNKLEIHMITLLFDRAREGFVFFKELSHTLNSLRLQQEAEAYIPPSPLISADRGWILGYFHCLTCKSLEEHPFHFTQLLSLNTYTEGICEIIRRHTRLCTPTIKVYLDESATEDSALVPERMLIDQSVPGGGTEWSPVEVHFYYRPGGFSQSDWSPTPMVDFLRLAHDPVLWSQMIIEVMRYEERVERRLAALSLDEPTGSGRVSVSQSARTDSLRT